MTARRVVLALLVRPAATMAPKAPRTSKAASIAVQGRTQTSPVLPSARSAGE